MDLYCPEHTEIIKLVYHSSVQADTALEAPYDVWICPVCDEPAEIWTVCDDP